jgi:tetratricopeptide (TPR) repeat protein
MLGFEQLLHRDPKLREEHFRRLRGERKEDEDELTQSIEKDLRSSEGRRSAIVAGFLWKGRRLQFKGVFEDQRLDGGGKTAPSDAPTRAEGAPNALQSGRLSDKQIRNALEADYEFAWKKAAEDFQQATSRTQQEAIQRRMQSAALELQRNLFREIFGRQSARALATNWIAQVAYERGDYQEAAEYFRHFREKELPSLKEKELNLFADVDAKKLPAEAKDQLEQRKRELQAQYEEFRKQMIDPWLPIWDNAARDGLARASEAAGDLAQAIELYEQDTSPDQRLGSLIRAKRLREQLAAKPEKAPKQR